jgi:hypothetical protein
MARHASLYQRLLWLYPAGFRREYGEEMVLVFTDRLREEVGRRGRGASARVWLHTLGDLALSAPKQQLEAFMSRPQTTPVQLFAVVATIVLTIAAASYFAGPLALVPFLALAAWLVYQERRAQYVRPRPSTWQRWVTAGVGLVAVAWVPAVAWLAITEWAWLAMMVLTFVAVVLVVIGVAMGMRDRPRGPVAPA